MQFNELSNNDAEPYTLEKKDYQNVDLVFAIISAFQ